ncbi:MAG TPA: cysteine--tRNA ligase [Acidimicrobiales bacterium]|nr:cysteine--tRNA ligase [Acidimicrobiales bacterium]
MGMRLYDTARDAVVPFEPGPVVTMYTCGITPYDAAHLGHAAVYLTFDVLQRRLRDAGHQTRCVRNVTDVDDDILRKARELGVHYLDLAAEEMARFDADMSSLGLLPVAAEPRATSAIADILSLIGVALDRGHAYRSGGAVYFDVTTFAGFGKVSHFDRDEMLRLAAVHGGNPDDPNKRNPLDFVLWQPSLPDEPAWESRWGPGRPGWHIECSALALRELGDTIDIHGGGRDLVFPHHECETAQSESVTGQPFVRHWLHVGLVGLHGTKMSKSLGNLVFVGDLVKEWEPMAVRLALLDHHYRPDWDWDDGDLATAADRLERWRAVTPMGSPAVLATGTPGAAGAAGGPGAEPADGPPVGEDPALDGVRDRLDDDLDTPGALAVVDGHAAAGRPVGAAAALLGIAL